MLSIGLHKYKSKTELKIKINNYKEKNYFRSKTLKCQNILMLKCLYVIHLDKTNSIIMAENSIQNPKCFVKIYNVPKQHNFTYMCITYI